MIAKTLVLFQRNLRTDNRSLSLALLRLAAAALVAIFLFFFTFSWSMRNVAGLEFFHQVIMINMVAVSLLGCSLFPAAITEEKEAQTLGLLRMAGVNAWAILLGKFGNRLWQALMLLLVQLPFAILAVTLGGVGLQQVLGGFVTLLLYAGSLAGIGLAVSVFARTRQGACAIAFLLILVGLLIPGWCYALGYWIVIQEEPPMETVSWLQTVSPVDRLNTIAAAGFGGAILWAPYSAIHLLVGLAGLLVARLGFDRFAVDTGPDDGGKGGLIGRLQSLPLLRPGPAWTGKATIWKDLHFVLGGRVGLVLRLLIIVGLSCFLLWILELDGVSSYRQNERFGQMLLGFGIPLFCAEVGWNLSRVVGQERNLATWPSLYALPLGIDRLLWSKIAAAFLPALLIGGWAAIGLFLIDGRDLNDEDAILAIFMMLGFTCFFWATTLFYATLIRWGAFALAIVTVVVSWVLAMMFMTIFFFAGPRNEEAFFLVAGLVYLGLAAGAFVLARGRLIRLAGSLG